MVNSNPKVTSNPNVTHATTYRRAVGVFKNRADVEAVLRSIKDSGYDMQRVSLIARHVDKVEGSDEISNTPSGERGETEAQEGAGVGASTGAVLGGVGGLLVGLGVLAIPGVGPILAAGVEINALASTLAGAGIGAAAGGIVGALVGLGIPEEQAKVYNDRVKAGQYLLLISGTSEELQRVESILRDRNVEEFNIYDAPDLNNTTTTGTTPSSTAHSSHQTVATTPNREQVPTGRATSEGIDLDRDGEAEVIVNDQRHTTNPRNGVNR